MTTVEPDDSDEARVVSAAELSLVVGQSSRCIRVPAMRKTEGTLPHYFATDVAFGAGAGCRGA